MIEFEVGEWYKISVLDHFVTGPLLIDEIMNHDDMVIVTTAMYLGERDSYDIYARDITEGGSEQQFETFWVIKDTYLGVVKATFPEE